jgi:hypothetical protein
MLESSMGSSDSPVTSRPRPDITDESLTEGYGEPSTSARTLGGGIDFFSSLGKERERKPKPDLPDPDKVTSNIYAAYLTGTTLPSSYMSAQRS